MRFLVTGAGGQLGCDLLAVLGDDAVGLDRATLDITDPDAVRDAVRAHRPDRVINAAAMTAVDTCETEVERAFAVNGAAVGRLAEACADVGAHLVTISTDYVFDGTKQGPYLEDDEPNPVSVYGQSKLEGERLAGPEATIIRTSWVCGEHGPNMVKTILRLLDEHDELRFVDDQIGCPTFTADLAPAVVALARDAAPGVFHVTNQGAVSWHRFAQDVARASGADPERVAPCATADLQPPRPAPRPANSVLENRRFVEAGYPALRHYREPLAELVAVLI